MTFFVLTLSLAQYALLAQTPATTKSVETAVSAVQVAPPPAARPQPAPNSPEGKAMAHYQKSRGLFGQRNYEQAIVELEAAYKLIRSADLLYNIARCYERMGQYGKAIDYYQRYLDGAVGAPDAEVVQGLIAHYRQKLAENATPSTPEEQAKVLARKGREYYRAGRFADAIDQLQRAQKVFANPAFIYNIAKCHEKMGDYDKAIVFYQRYLTMDPEASDKSDVLSLISSLQSRMKQTLSELTVRTVPAGTDVYIDNMSKMLGQTPLEVRLKPGPHKLALVKNGYESILRDFEMPEDRPRDLAYALQKVKNFGGISIESNVNGAQIFLDGRIMGLTPYTVTKLVSQGKHQLTVQREGYYLYQADVTIERGRLTRVEANLRERGQLTGWVTTLGTWVTGLSAIAGGSTAVVSYWLGGYTVQGTPINEGFWTAQQIGMYGGLAGAVVGLGLVGLDLLIQPSDVYELRMPSDDLPMELIKSGELGVGGEL